MNPLWAEAKKKLTELLQLSPEDRDEQLSQLQTENPSLAEAVQELMSGADEKTEQVISPEADTIATTRRLMFDVGDRIGDYIVEGFLGQGGQGAVILATDSKLGRKAALKMIPYRPGVRSSAPQRLLREATAASRLDHPGICSIYELGEYEGAPYLAMQYIEGESLMERIRRARENSQSMAFESLEEVLSYFEKAALALHAAHEAGLVHRDIKPSNLMVTKDNEPVILDFGLARDNDSTDASLTETGDLIGTPTHMSPEQVEDAKGITRTTDIWSLGVTLYQALTLILPFYKPKREELLRSIRLDPADSIRTSNANFSKDLDIVLMTAMEKDPDRRYATARDLADDLAAVREHRVIKARPVSGVTKTLRWARRRPALATLVVALIITIPVIAGLGGFLFANLDDLKAQKEANLKEEYEDIIDDAYFELTEGSAEKATELFAKARSLISDTGEAASGQVIALNTLDRHEQAQQVLAKNEKYIRDEAALVLLKQDSNLIKKSVVDIEPTSSFGYFFCGYRDLLLSTRMMNELEEQKACLSAYRQLRRAVLGTKNARRSHHFQLIHALGRLREDFVDLQERRDVVGAIAQLWPTDARANYWCGRSLDIYDPEAALKHYQIAIDGKSNVAKSLMSSARINLMLKRNDVAKRYLERLERDYPERYQSNAIQSVVARYHGACGNIDDEIAAYRLCLKDSHHPKDIAESQWRLGQAILKQGVTDEAVDLLHSALKTNPGDASAHHNLANLYTKTGKPGRALEHFDKAIALDPTWDDPWIKSLNILMQQGRTKEAFDKVKVALTKEKKSGPLRATAAHIHFVNRDMETGLRLIDEAVKLAPDELFVRTTALVAHCSARRPDLAKKSYEALKKIEEQDAKSWNAQAFYLKTAGNMPGAEHAYRETLKLDPNDKNATGELAEIVTKQGLWEEGDRLFRKLGTLVRQTEGQLNSVATYAAKNRRFLVASELAAKSTQVNPKSAGNWFLLGSMLLRQGRVAEATEALQEGTKFEKNGGPSDCTAWLRDPRSPLQKAPQALEDLRLFLASSQRDRIRISDLQSRILGSSGEQALIKLWIDHLSKNPKDVPLYGDFAAIAAARSIRFEKASTTAQRAERNKLAMTWLSARIKALRAESDDAIQSALKAWQNNRFIRAICPDGIQPHMPKADRTEWATFWSELESSSG